MTGQKLILLSARDVTGTRTGRITVLETAVRSLQAIGYSLEILALTKDQGPSTWLGCPVHRIETPSVKTLPPRALRALVSGKTLNEIVFDSSGVQGQVARLCQQLGARAIIGDGIRTWNLAKSTGLPIVMHLDDLLSERYSSESFQANNDSVLGYFGEQIPAPLLPLAEGLAGRLLGLEAKNAYQREIQIAQEAQAVALTGKEEAQILAERAGVKVYDLPMAVAQGELISAGNNPANQLVFLGAMHYSPNLGALRYFRDQVLPVLQERGRSLELTIIGKIDPKVQAEFAGSPIFFKGYVDDLQAELSKYRIFISPVQSGTGIKTKVLDAFSIGLPVVASPLGVAGIPRSDEEAYLVGETPAELASYIEELMDQPERANQIGAAGYRLLGEEMNPKIVEDNWKTALEQALEGNK